MAGTRTRADRARGAEATAPSRDAVGGAAARPRRTPASEARARMSHPDALLPTGTGTPGRAAWRGHLVVRLLVLGISLYRATEPHGVSFRLLHASCGSPIQMRTLCAAEGVEIRRADTVRGYEYEPDQFLPLSDADLAALPLASTETVEVRQFAPAVHGATMARFAQQTYYVVPERVARRACELLRSLLVERALVGVATVVIAQREHLALLVPHGTGLALVTLCWPDEVRPAPAVPLAAGDVASAAERALAVRLLASMTAPLELSHYHDAYRAALVALVEQRLAGRPPLPSTAAPPTSPLVDLMAALEASVAASRAARENRSASAPTVSPVRRRSRRSAA